MSGKTFFAAIVCGLIAIAIQPMSAAAAPPTLAGSWQFTLTPTTPPTPAIEIPGLATFTTNGSVIETAGSEFATIPVSTSAAPTATSSGHGIWEIGNTPGSWFIQYFSLVINPDGSLYARNVTTMIVSMSSTGKTLSGSYTTDQVQGGSTRVVSSGTVSATLIPHIPLP